MSKLEDSFVALIDGRYHDPFSLLGLHKVGRDRVVRTFQPQADAVELISVDGKHLADMQRIHEDGLFSAVMPPRIRRYRLRLTRGKHTWEAEDPYRFPQSLGDLDLYLLGPVLAGRRIG
jgi:1,4-alpha-glucan branching enzyme